MTKNHINSPKEDQKLKVIALTTMCSIFFLWGFITVLNDILVPQLKANFNLNYTQAMLIQFCFFFAYFVMSIPAGQYIKRAGYKKGIQTGLMISGAGCYLFYPATYFKMYPLFLCALFIMAAGIAMMQVAGNPYVSALGPNKTAASRLSIAATCNSLGTAIGPQFGAVLILTASLIAGASALHAPYLILGTLLFVIAFMMRFINLPHIKDIETHTNASFKKLLQARHLYIGAWSIFFYVGAEVTIGSFMINYLAFDQGGALNETQAAKMLSLYWGGAMVGRFIGAFVMRYIDEKKVLAFNAISSTILLLVTINTFGTTAMVAVLAVGLCNSIMFPTIFSTAIYALEELTSKGSGLLCTAIVGGAFIPLLQGVCADFIGIKLSFIIPLCCYLFIFYYAMNTNKLQSSWRLQQAKTA